MRRTRTLAHLFAALGLVAGSAALSVPAADAAPTKKVESISCDTVRGSRGFYPGADSSDRYDGLFGPKAGHAVPQGLLDHYLPQGLATWPNWGGPGKDLLLLTAYHRSTGVAVIIGIVPGGGVTKTVRLTAGALGHAGGAAVVNGHLFVSAPGNNVKRFSLTTLRSRLKTGGTIAGSKPIPVVADSFLGGYGNTLWAGQFTDQPRSDTNKPKMYPYTVSRAGTLTRSGSAVEVPIKTQGVVITKDRFVYSTAYGSKNRGNLYVETRGFTSLDDAYPANLTCFRSPSLGEGITASNGTLYLTFESGSYIYGTDPCDKPQPFEGDCTLNIIKNLHHAKLAELSALIQPVADN